MNWEMYADEKGIKVDTIRVRLKRAGLSGFDRYAKPTAEQLAIIEGGRRSRTRSKVAYSHTTTARTVPIQSAQQEEQKQEMPGKNRREYLLDVINVGECLLVLAGGLVQFGVPGLIPATMAVAYYAYTAYEMADSETGDSAKSMSLFVCALLSCVFMWLHGQTFYEWMPESAGRYWVAFVSSAIISGISFAALFQKWYVRT